MVRYGPEFESHVSGRFCHSRENKKIERIPFLLCVLKTNWCFICLNSCCKSDTLKSWNMVKEDNHCLSVMLHCYYKRLSKTYSQVL